MVFCISEEAVNNFVIDDEAVSFQARFGESISNIYIPLNRVAAVYPKEDTNLVTYFPVTPTPEKKVKKMNLRTSPSLRKSDLHLYNALFLPQ